MHKRQIVPVFICIFLFLVLTGSCDRKRFFEENIAIPEGQWNSRNHVIFNVDIPTITAPFNVYLNLRNTPDYPFSNLFLFMTTHYPDGTSSADTLELLLADYQGRWLGKGMGSVRYNRFLLKKSLHFPAKGKYRFEFEQAMRTPVLKGIKDIGFRIEHN